MPLTGDNSSQAIHIKKLLYHSLKTLDTARNAKKNLKKKQNNTKKILKK